MLSINCEIHKTQKRIFWFFNIALSADLKASVSLYMLLIYTCKGRKPAKPAQTWSFSFPNDRSQLKGDIKYRGLPSCNMKGNECRDCASRSTRKIVRRLSAICGINHDVTIANNCSTSVKVFIGTINFAAAHVMWHARAAPNYKCVVPCGGVACNPIKIKLRLWLEWRDVLPQ